MTEVERAVSQIFAGVEQKLQVADEEIRGFTA